jgi:two-component system, NtrC family, sensor kinase
LSRTSHQKTLEKLEFLEQLKEQWMAMIDAVDDSLVIIDNEYKIQRQNYSYFSNSFLKNSPEAQKISQKNLNTELAIQDFKNKKCFEVFAGRESPCEHCKIKNLKAPEENEFWSTHQLFPENPEFGEKHFEIRARLLTNNQFMVHYRNVTAVKQMQENLARTDKLSALGHMAGGVAHEINSPLAGILAFAQMVLKEMEESNIHYPDLREIEDAARKCKVIVEGLLGFARQEKPKDIGEFSVVEAIESTIRLAKPILRKNLVSIDFSANEALKNLKVEGHKSKLEQVFLNLFTNASYAMRLGGGVISVWMLENKNFLDVFVQDSGEGMDQKILSKIFDPFYTTKPFGEGTGLGLSVSYSHIKQMGGEISVTSKRSEGSIFQVSLPLKK